MLSSGAATVIVLTILSAIALAAAVVGFIATGVLGMDWSLRTGVADAATAIAIYALCTVALVLLEAEEGVRLISAVIAAVLGGGVLRHAARRVLVREPGAPAP